MSDSDELVDPNDAWSNCDDWNDDSSTACICLLCDSVLFSSDLCFEHMITDHQFDFHSIKSQLNLDFYSTIRLINFLRAQSKSGTAVSFQAAVDQSGEWKTNDKYLVPSISDDPLLYAFDDDDENEDEDGVGTLNKVIVNKVQKVECIDLIEAISQLKLQLHEKTRSLIDLTSGFESYKQMVKDTFMSKDLKMAVEADIASGVKVQFPDQGNYYFESYASNEIHETMLKDTVRTEGYRDFIYNNKSYFKDKIVMDVGCGTGILSMFAAKAVYAIDNSNIISKAREIARENCLEGKITFLRGKVEEVELPCKVDIIISEWMGYFLLYEGMLDSVLVARDRWLKADGIMAPSSTKIYIAAFGDAEWYNDTINFWNDIYGFSMKSMSTKSTQNGIIHVVNGASLISDTVLIQDIDTKTTTVAQLDFVEAFELKINKIGKVYAFCGWFDTHFEGLGIESNSFTTSPCSQSTHWMQTLFVLEQPLLVAVGDVISGTFASKKSLKNFRELVIDICFRVNGGEPVSQTFGVV